VFVLEIMVSILAAGSLGKTIETAASNILKRLPKRSWCVQPFH
jgi:hypothetical protein